MTLIKCHTCNQYHEYDDRCRGLQFYERKVICEECYEKIIGDEDDETVPIQQGD